MNTKERKEKLKMNFAKIGEMFEEIAEKVPILVDKKERPRKFISTGNLLLNASLSGSLFGGIADMGISVFAGPEASGKTFLALNIAREAQALGKGVVYIDTEYAINRTELHKYGIDPSPDKFIIIRANQVEEINMAVTQMIDELKKAKMNGYELPEQIWFLDSLAQLSSKKMKEDLIAGNFKTDMSKAKAIGAMFVSITADLNFLEIPLIVNNQLYLDINSFFPTEVMKGGKQLYYSANTITFFSKSKLKTEETDENDIQPGIEILSKTFKNRICKPKKIRFSISFTNGMNKYIGLELFCRPEFFNTIGIAQGKMDVDKKTGEEKFTPGGTRWYVKHLGKSVTLKQLHTDMVFTDNVLNAMEPIVNSYFKYGSNEEAEATQKELDMLIDNDDNDTDISKDTGLKVSSENWLETGE